MRRQGRHTDSRNLNGYTLYPVQRLTGESGLVGQCGHTAHGVDYGAQRNGNRARVTVLEYGIKERGDLGITS
jgi:hypothetical protein